MITQNIWNLVWYSDESSIQVSGIQMNSVFRCPVFWSFQIVFFQDVALGLVMLGIQSAQCLSAFLQMWPKLKLGSGYQATQAGYTKLKSPPQTQDWIYWTPPTHKDCIDVFMQ